MLELWIKIGVVAVCLFLFFYLIVRYGSRSKFEDTIEEEIEEETEEQVKLKELFLEKVGQQEQWESDDSYSEDVTVTETKTKSISLTKIVPTVMMFTIVIVVLSIGTDVLKQPEIQESLNETVFGSSLNGLLDFGMVGVIVVIAAVAIGFVINSFRIND